MRGSLKSMRTNSLRNLRSPSNNEVGDPEVVYRQSSIHSIDIAPEPPEFPDRNHALSAASPRKLSEELMNSGRRMLRRHSSKNESEEKRNSSRRMGSVELGSSSRRSVSLESASKKPSSPPETIKNVKPQGWDSEGYAIQNFDSSSEESGANFSLSDDSSSSSMELPDMSGYPHDAQMSSSTGVYMNASMGNVSLLSRDEEDLVEERAVTVSVSSYGESDSALYLFGWELPNCIAHPPTCFGVAELITTTAPCFWCLSKQESSTDRTVLTRLNILCAFFALGQLAATAWLVVVMLIPPGKTYDDGFVNQTYGMAPNLWSLNGAMYCVGVLAIVIFITSTLTLKIIRVVNLVGAIRYLWVMLWIIPFEVFCIVTLFDYHNVTVVWVKHWWNVPCMGWFRDRYCAEGTASTLCTVPIASKESEEIWCLSNFNVTGCTEIRNDAQHKVELLLRIFYYGNASWGVILVYILCLTANTLERIISKPLVQKSRESNVPAWLTLPIIGCCFVGAGLVWSPSSVLNASTNYGWIGLGYMVSGGIFLLAAGLGWFMSSFSILSTRDKHYKQLAVFCFILLMLFTSFVLTSILVASISYTVELLTIDASKRGDIACSADTAGSCTICTDGLAGTELCPEWSMSDVTSVLQTQTKGSATLAAIFLLYAFSALRFGLILRKHLSRYQIDYV